MYKKIGLYAACVFSLCLIIQSKAESGLPWSFEGSAEDLIAKYAPSPEWDSFRKWTYEGNDVVLIAKTQGSGRVWVDIFLFTKPSTKQEWSLCLYWNTVWSDLDLQEAIGEKIEIRNAKGEIAFSISVPGLFSEGGKGMEGAAKKASQGDRELEKNKGPVKP